MIDQSQTRNEDDIKKPHALGVLFVHGIGSQKRGDTLVQWGDVLAETVNRSSQGQSTATIDAAHIVATPENGEVAPAYAQLSLRSNGREPSSWLLAEASWAETLTTPSYAQLVSWSVRSIPWVLVVHFALRFRTLRGRIAAAAEAPPKAVLIAEMILGSIGGFLLALLAAPILVTLLAVLLIIGRIPIPTVRSFVGNLQRKLTGTAGDSLILLESPIQAAAIRSTVRDAIQWLDNSCQRVAVVAHSQGAAISMEALGGFASAEQRHLGEYATPKSLQTFVTFGSGINKLAALKLLARRGDSQTGGPNADREINPWMASLLLMAVLALGSGIWIRMVSGQLTGKDLGHAAVYILIVFAMICFALLAWYTAKKLGGSQAVIRSTSAIAIIAGLCGLFYFLSVTPVSGFFLFGFLALIFLVMMVIGSFREEVLTRVGETMCRPSGVKKWLDFYASADPVPNGETIVSRDSAKGVEVWNSGSRFADHTTYWRSIDGFVIPLIRCLAETAESPLAAHLPDETESVPARARRRLRWLVTARALVALIAVGYLLWRWSELSKLGAQLRDRVPSSLGFARFIETPGQISSATASIIGASIVLLAAWIGYAVVRYFWWRWAQSEQRLVASHSEPAGRPAAFWVFAMALGAVLSAVSIIERAAREIRGSPGWSNDLASWNDLAFVWLGFVLLLCLVFVLPFTRWGPLALRQSSERAAGERSHSEVRPLESTAADSMEESYSNSIGLPEPHAALLKGVVNRLKPDSRFVGVAVGGSYLTQSIDEFSDLDLVIAIEPAAFEAVLNERSEIAAFIGPLLAAFTGEHVGEPRLLICLYGPPLLHVDLKFISLADAADRVEDPAVVWERDGRFTAALQAGSARYPAPDLQWIEDRFWIWVHYGAGKIGRGELFEAVGFLAYLRAEVLGPLSLLVSGHRPAGVRKLEAAAPGLARQMETTMAAYDAGECAAALRATGEMYRELRASLASKDLRVNARAEEAAMAYLAEIEARCG